MPIYLATCSTTDQIAQSLKTSPIRPPLRMERSSPLLHSGRRAPGVDALLQPDRNGDGADLAPLATEVGDHPAPLTHLDLLLYM